MSLGASVIVRSAGMHNFPTLKPQDDGETSNSGSSSEATTQPPPEVHHTKHPHPAPQEKVDEEGNIKLDRFNCCIML